MYKVHIILQMICRVVSILCTVSWILYNHEIDQEHTQSSFFTSIAVSLNLRTPSSSSFFFFFFQLFTWKRISDVKQHAVELIQGLHPNGSTDTYIYTNIFPRFFAIALVRPLTIFPNQIRFITANADGTRMTKRSPNMCIRMSCQSTKKH